MPSRPASRAASAMPKPLPSLADQVAAGTRAASKIICAVTDAAHAHLVLGAAAACTPGRLRGNVHAADPAGRVAARQGSPDVRANNGVEVGLPGMRDPRLDPVDNEVRADRLRRWCASPTHQSRWLVRTGSRRLAGRRRACPGSQRSCCSAVPARDQREAGERVHAQPEADGQPGFRQFLDDLQVRLVGLPATAEASPGRAG